jgi:hypothetical protein
VFEAHSLRRALDLQERSYRLLQWLDDGLRRGALAFDAVHDAVSLPDATRAWLERHLGDLPARCRPAPADLAEFSRLVATALESAFDLAPRPGQRRYSPGAHCFCPFCSWMVAAPHLTPKKLSARDKRRATALEVDVVRALATERGVTLDAAEAARIAQATALREPVALLAWARILLQRLEGLSEGPATLALWRRFAWTATGAPKPGFALDAAHVLAAEELVVEHLRALGDASAGAGQAPTERERPRDAEGA